MKNIVLIVNATVHQAVADKLRSLDVTGFTVSHVEGHGVHAAEDPFLSLRDRVVGFIPRVRIDIVLPAERVAAVANALCEPDTGLVGHGVLWVSSVERFVQF